MAVTTKEARKCLDYWRRIPSILAALEQTAAWTHEQVEYYKSKYSDLMETSKGDRPAARIALKEALHARACYEDCAITVQTLRERLTEDRAFLTEQIGRLPPGDMQIILMRVDQRMTFMRIADRLYYSEDRIRHKYMDAVRRLAARIPKEWYDGRVEGRIEIPRGLDADQARQLRESWTAVDDVASERSRVAKPGSQKQEPPPAPEGRA